MLPMPSTVVTAIPWIAQIGVRQAFTAKCCTPTSGLYLDTMTVQAPHPPSPHPNFEPVSCTGTVKVKDMCRKKFLMGEVGGGGVYCVLCATD